MLLRVLLLCAVAATGIGTSAGAQPAPQGEAAKTVAPVTVVGKRITDKQMIKTVIAPFVDLHAARDRKTGLLVRAPKSGICPLVLGLSPAFNAYVTARIVAVAKGVGAVAEAGKCAPNVEVVFTEGPQKLVDTLANRTGGRILGFHYSGEYGALTRVSHPIQAWYMTGTLNRTPPEATRVLDPFGPGDSTSSPTLQSATPIQVGGTPDVVIDNAYWPDPYSGTGSRLRQRNSSQLTNVLIVADLNKLDGREIGPIADYVAMLSLTQPRSLDACNTLPSVLDMLATGCGDRAAPQGLTDSDLAFLKALYASDITTSGDQGGEKVALCMAQDVAGTAGAPKACGARPSK